MNPRSQIPASIAVRENLASPGPGGVRSRMVKIEKGNRVRIKVLLEVEGGDVIEQSAVEYFQGAGTMLPGLEEVLEGLAVGAKRDGTIPPERAFGAAQHQHPKVIPRSEFPAEVELAPGAEFAAKGANGQDVLLRVEEIGDGQVHAKLLHPLHDKTIRYEVEVLSVTHPSPPPLPADAVAADDE